MIATCDGSRRWVAGAHLLRGSPRVDAVHFGGFCKASAPLATQNHTASGSRQGDRQRREPITAKH